MSLPMLLPYPLGAALSTATYTRSGIAFNYAIGALPFLSAASAENPIVRKLAPYRKQQFDNSLEPGEQSLDGWWMRSQLSFHHGAGQLYGDPGLRGDSADPYRWWTSYNVDPWTAGTVKLLRSTSLAVAGEAVTKLISYVDSTHGDAVFGVTEDSIVFRSLDGGRDLVEANPSATDLQSCAFDGTNFYVSALDGVWQATSVGGAWTKIWDIGTLPNVIGWVKRRLILATSAGVYELVGAGLPLPTAKYVTSPAGQTPTGIAEGANTIFVSYYLNSQSEIIRFGLGDDGAMPTLSGGAVAAQLPDGETVRSLAGYLGRYLLIGTNRGARVAAIADSGAIEYGPRLFETASPVLGWAADDRFAWCTVTAGHAEGARSGLFRIDLSTDLGSLQFAYAADLVLADVGEALSVAHAGASTSKMLATPTGLYAEDATYASTGWIESSRVRFGTLEPKVYKLLRVRGPALAGPAQSSVIAPAGTTVGVAGWAAVVEPGSVDNSIPLPPAVEYVSVRLDLQPSDDGTASAELSGWQLKALPATPRQRLMQLPLWCFDYEKDRYGVRYGRAGSAQERLRALEDLAASVDVVSFQDLDANRLERVVVDDIEFVQTSPPGHFEGWGGLVTVTMRTV